MLDITIVLHRISDCREENNWNRNVDFMLLLISKVGL